MSNNKPTVSQCHSLRLMTIGSLQYFYTDGMQAHLRCRKEPYNLKEAPGTLLSSVSHSDGIFKKELTCSIVTTSPEQADRLRLLSSAPLIATYTDEHGDRRVCGAPECPLKLTYSGTAGWVDLTLMGVSDRMDLYL